jgi:ferritin-like metal-binding protein YciE
MKIQQTIEIRVSGPEHLAFAQIVMGTKRSAQKKFASLEAAKVDAETMVAKYGATISWAETNGDTNLALIGSYEFEAPNVEKRA